MNSSAHLHSSASTLTLTTGAILTEKRSLSNHGGPYRIDLSTSAPPPSRQNLSPSAFQHRAGACSTSCPLVTHSTLAKHDMLLTSHGGPTAHLETCPPGCPPFLRLHANTSFTTSRNEVVEMHGRTTPNKLLLDCFPNLLLRLLTLVEKHIDLSDVRIAHHQEHLKYSLGFSLKKKANTSAKLFLIVIMLSIHFAQTIINILYMS